MPELKEICEKLVEKFSENADTRKLVVATLAEAFLSETTDTKKIQNAQRSLVKFIGKIIKNLSSINKYISENAEQYISDYDIAHAARLIEQELTYIALLKEEFFNTLKPLPIGPIGIDTIKQRINVDKIRTAISRLNILVGNVKWQLESEETLITELKKKIAKAA